MFEEIKNDYYAGYQLNEGIEIWDLTETELIRLNVCVFFIDNNASIRETARNFCLGKSEIHRILNCKIRKLSYELCKCCKRQLVQHRKER